MARIRWVASLMALLLLCSCSAVHRGPDPIPGQGFYGIVHINGDFDAQAFGYSVPLTALVRAHGKATVTLRAWPAPHLVFDGDGAVIVEPVPGREAEAIAAVQRGDILIRRNGIAGALNAPGARAGYIAGLIRASSAKRAAEIQRAVEAQRPPPTPVTFAPPECSDDECRDGNCLLVRR